MYRSIVVGTDGSETAARALDEAIRLASAFGASLHVVMAVRPTSALLTLASAAGLDTSVTHLEQAARDEARGVLEEARAAAGAAGVTAEVYAPDGNPSDALCDVAEARSADLIVVGNKGMQGTRRMLGSVPSSVAHHAACSVLIVQTT